VPEPEEESTRAEAAAPRHNNNNNNDDDVAVTHEEHALRCSTGALVHYGLGSGPTSYGARGGASIVDASPVADSSPNSPLPDVAVSPEVAADGSTVSRPHSRPSSRRASFGSHGVAAGFAEEAAELAAHLAAERRGDSVRLSWQLGSGPTLLGRPEGDVSVSPQPVDSSDTSPLPSASPDGARHVPPARSNNPSGQEREHMSTRSHVRHVIAEGGIASCPPFDHAAESAGKEVREPSHPSKSGWQSVGSCTHTHMGGCACANCVVGVRVQNHPNRSAPVATNPPPTKPTAAKRGPTTVTTERESKSVSALRESVATLRSASSSPLLDSHLDLCVSCWETVYVCKCEAKAEREESRRILETREPPVRSMLQ